MATIDEQMMAGVRELQANLDAHRKTCLAVIFGCHTCAAATTVRYLVDELVKRPALTDVEREIRAERTRQDAKWGDQSGLPDYDPHDIPEAIRNHYAFYTDRWKQINAQRPAEGGCEVSGRAAPVGGPCTAWDGILLEEVYEALAEDDEEARITELVQVAAVAVQMIEAIRTRQARRAELAEAHARVAEVLAKGVTS